LPPGKKVIIYCPSTGRTVVVPVIDKGPGKNGVLPPDPYWNTDGIPPWEGHGIDMTVGTAKLIGIQVGTDKNTGLSVTVGSSEVMWRFPDEEFDRSRWRVR
jgi:hypothetical protein